MVGRNQVTPGTRQHHFTNVRPRRSRSRIQTKYDVILSILDDMIFGGEGYSEVVAWMERASGDFDTGDYSEGGMGQGKEKDDGRKKFVQHAFGWKVRYEMSNMRWRKVKASSADVVPPPPHCVPSYTSTRKFPDFPVFFTYIPLAAAKNAALDRSCNLLIPPRVREDPNGDAYT